MTVYVDDMAASFSPKHRTDRKYVLSHMIADTEGELHAMADRIGVARRWYQGDHYDISQTKRVLAIQFGAVAITQKQLGLMAINRRAGYAMGTPETAEEIWRKRWEERQNKQQSNWPY